MRRSVIRPDVVSTKSSSERATPVLILSGSLGSGKTAVAGAVHDVLSTQHVPHACLDLDVLAYSWPPVEPYNEGLVIDGLGKLWPIYKAAGAERLVLARVIETRDGLRRYADAIGNAEVVVCRLVASEETRKARLRSREDGPTLEHHLARTVELEEILEHAAVEDFVVVNEGQPVESVAKAILARAGWVADVGDAQSDGARAV